MRWFTSDLHFFHNNIISYCNRPYADVQRMNQAIVFQWNHQVAPSDTVWFLGDFSINKSEVFNKELVTSLNGKKYLILGNHDAGFNTIHQNKKLNYQKYYDAGWEQVFSTMTIDLKNGQTVIMSHLPPTNDEDSRYTEYKHSYSSNNFYLFGHLHGHFKKKNNMLDVCFDADLKLLSEDDVIALIEDPREFIPTRLTDKYKQQNLFLMPFDEEVKLGFIQKQVKGDLVLYNYNDKCTYEKHWNEVTTNSRGIIFNRNTGALVALPLPKFFNLGEAASTKLETLPNLPYTVTEKMDGCFLYNTKVNCWDGSTVKIGDIVKGKIKNPILIGMNKEGLLVPNKVVNVFDNGKKNNWLEITLSCRISKKSGGWFKNKLKVTNNHHIYINNEFKPALNAKINDIVTTYENYIDNDIIHIIRSGLLGDGSVCKSHNACRYSEDHKIEHEEYVDYLYKIFNDFGIKKDYRTSGFGTKMVRFRSRALKELKNIYNEWYDENGKKFVPKDLHWIDDFTIAKWYMDDGCLLHSSKQKDRACFATHGFKKEDVERLAQKLRDMYKINVSIEFSKGWYIRVNAGKNNEIVNFWNKISPYIIKCMQYKLPESYRNNTEIKLPTIGKCIKIKKEAVIENIKTIENTKKNFPFGRKGFDIGTETTNYFINGILVHNSLGIIYYYNDQWNVATRGSFNSEQAQEAQKMLSKYNMEEVPKHLTLLCEIIYPENKIVVKYDFSELVLLTINDTKTLKELSRQDVIDLSNKMLMPIVEEKALTIEQMIQLQSTMPAQEEGFVVRYANGLRVKIKGKEYMKLHRMISNMTPLAFYETMINGKVNIDYLQELPEEYRKEADELSLKLEKAYDKVRQDLSNQVELMIRSIGFVSMKNPEDRKKVGLYIKDNKPQHSSGFFHILDGSMESLDKFIMKQIRPTGNII